MKVTVAFNVVIGAAAHGSMSIPRPRNAGSSATHPSTGSDMSCVGDACYWYQVGCYIGCSECSNEGKSLYPQPYCSNPIEPTNNDPTTRSWDPLGQSSHGDFTKYNPWRAPGKAPVVDPCGDASGYQNPGAYADIPKGYTAFAKGSEVLPESAATYWKAGGAAEVAWALSAQHGGGYSYRLCPKGQTLTEACFQSNHLSFTSKNTTVRYHDGSKADFQIPTANLITSGQHWRRNPIPGCACDLGWGCGNKEAVESSAHAHATGGVDLTPYANHGPATPACPHGTMFDAGWTPEGEGFLVGTSTAFSIVDEVQVPNTPGDYVLSWRWDCEQTDQVWNSCADIKITDGPIPSPTPSPPTPPSPPAPPSPPPAGKKDYICWENKCYEKPGYGTMDQATCEKDCSGPSPSPAPSKGDYLCFNNICYEKPGSGTMDKATCDKECGNSLFV